MNASQESQTQQQQLQQQIQEQQQKLQLEIQQRKEQVSNSPGSPSAEADAKAFAAARSLKEPEPQKKRGRPKKETQDSEQDDVALAAFADPELYSMLLVSLMDVVMQRVKGRNYTAQEQKRIERAVEKWSKVEKPKLSPKNLARLSVVAAIVMPLVPGLGEPDAEQNNNSAGHEGQRENNPRKIPDQETPENSISGSQPGVQGGLNLSLIPAAATVAR